MITTDDINYAVYVSLTAANIFTEKLPVLTKAIMYLKVTAF